MIIEAKPLHKKKKRLAKQNSKRESKREKERRESTNSEPVSYTHPTFFITNYFSNVTFTMLLQVPHIKVHNTIIYTC